MGHPYGTVWGMAVTQTPRERWVEAGLEALGAGGPEAVRIEPLAKTLGVTKGGFYWHFEDRQALLDELLDSWERLSVDTAIELVETAGSDPRERLRMLSSLASAQILDIDLAVRDWARRDAAVAARLRRIDNRRMDYLRSLFLDLGADEDDAEARSMLAFSLWIGNHFIAADHGARGREAVVKTALERLLAEPS
jgi:AcrR family transcriptional regulator